MALKRVTVSVAALLVTLPAELLTTTVNGALSAVVVAGVGVARQFAPPANRSSATGKLTASAGC